MWECEGKTLPKRTKVEKKYNGGKMYFNYHAKLKRLIETGKAIGYERLENYHGISPCILVYFKGERPMPIREHRFEEYIFLFAKFQVEEVKR